MKYSIRFFVILNLLPAFCCGQQVMWQNHYGGEYYETLPGGGIPDNSKIIQNQNGEYIIVGHTNSFNVHANQYAFKIDNSGNLIWQFNAGHPWENDGTHANIRTFDGYYFIVGNANMQSVDPNEIRLTKFNELGDTIFSKIIVSTNEYSASPRDICYSVDNNYITVCASTFNIYLVKFNNDGDTLWFKRPLPDSIGSAAPVFFQPAPDFSAYYGIITQNNLKTHWFKTDTAGTLLNIKELVLPGNEDEIFEIYKAIILPSGNIMLHGRGFASIVSDTVCPQPGGYYGVLHEYNQQGELIRERKFCPPLEGGNTYYEYFDDFIVNADGSIYMIRRTRLKKLDANWQDVWEYELDLAPEVNLLKVSQFEPNYLIAAGELWIDSEDTDIFMCKIALPEAIGVEENEEALKFNAYPNPTTGQLTMESSIPGVTAYTIIAIDGRLVTQGSFSIRSELNISTLSAGTYYLGMSDATGNIHYRTLIAKQ